MDTSAIIIRAGENRDLAALARLHARCFQEEAWPVASLATLLAAPVNFCLVAANGANGAPIGFMLGQAIAGEAEVVTLAVDPAVQGRGLGRRLLAAALATAAALGAQEIFLEVADDNPRARSLYDGAGFVTFGRRTGYYRRRGEVPVDALMMRLSGDSVPRRPLA